MVKTCLVLGVFGLEEKLERKKYVREGVGREEEVRNKIDLCIVWYKRNRREKNIIIS